MQTHWLLIATLIAGLGLAACQKPAGAGPSAITSPDGQLELQTFLDAAGRPGYRLTRAGAVVIDSSYLGYRLQGAAALDQGFSVARATTREIDETWDMVWGEDATVRNHCRELRLELTEASGRRLDLVFRLFDDGLGFRYEMPAQAGVDSVLITEELTEFALTGDHTAWWIPGDWDIYEHLYTRSRLSEIDAGAKRNHPNLAQTYIPDARAVNTPVTMKTDDGLYLSFHEAALIDYPDMTLHVDVDQPTLRSALVAWPDGILVKTRAPFVSPWRTVLVATRAGDLIASKLVLNLNEPSKIEDTGWIKPTKYVGIWWEMHLGKSTWDYAGQQDMNTYVDPNALRPSGKHGATTENAKRYIDFAAARGIGGLLVEGWNTGWENWIGPNRPEKPFDFVTPYPDFDIAEVVRYGAEKGVALIGHHETSACVDSYEEQLDTAFAFYQNLGIHAVKTGYVGPIQPDGERHHSQWMVRHYQRVVEVAAAHQVMVNAHEPIKATGLRRTWPNFMAREGLRGQEFNAWATDGGNPPNHLPTVAFTRMLAGPIDFTPGVFHIKFDEYKPDNQVNTTLAQQLALYVVIYGPLQMACDLPEHYEGQPAFQFIEDVAVDWQQSRVLDGEVGEHVTIARQEKGGERWFLGSITNEEGRSFTLPLDFLSPGVTYRAKLYADAPDAHWDDNPTALVISEQEVTAADVLPVTLAPGGGLAVSFEPVE